jgi:hypothetical protein
VLTLKNLCGQPFSQFSRRKHGKKVGRTGFLEYISVRRSRPTGDLFFCVAKKTGQKDEPLHGRAKIPRLFLAHPLKANLAQLFSTDSTKNLPMLWSNKQGHLIRLKD